jgi:Family of unknown function (DUF5343)
MRLVQGSVPRTTHPHKAIGTEQAMAYPNSYMTSTKNLTSILAAIQKAGVPPKFTYDFLKKLGFPSSNDRPIIPLLKAMRFLDEGGVPLDRYKRYRDIPNARAVLAEGMREAYSDVFAVDQQAQDLDQEALKGIFARISGKSDRVVEQMALTFKTMSTYADWEATPEPEEQLPTEEEGREDETPTPASSADDTGTPPPHDRSLARLNLHHDIHIHLPITDQISVYDAIFRALRQNFDG